MKLLDIIFESVVDLNEMPSKLTDDDVKDQLVNLNSTYDFSNVKIERTKNSKVVIKNYSCVKHPNWVQDDWVIFSNIKYDLTNPKPLGGRGGMKWDFECDGCYHERKRQQKINQLKSYPELNKYNFDNLEIKYVKASLTYISNIYCTVKDKNGEDHGYFPKEGDKDILIGSLINGDVSCPKCRRKKSTKYTKEQIIQIIKDNKGKLRKYSQFLSDFPGAYQSSRSFGPCYDNDTKEEVPCKTYFKGKEVKCTNCTNSLEFFNSVTKDFDKGEYSDKFIYVHEFYYPNGEKYAAYVGLTDNEEERFCSHTKGEFRGKKCEDSEVTKIIREYPTYKHVYKKLTDFMDAREAQESEGYWDLKYQEMGFIRLGKAKTGKNHSSLGRVAYHNIKNIDRKFEEWKESKFKNNEIPNAVSLKKDLYNLYSSIITRKNSYTKSWVMRGILDIQSSRLNMISTMSDFDLIKISMSCKNYEDFDKNYRPYSEEVNNREGLKEKIESHFENKDNQYENYVQLFKPEKKDKYSQENILRLGKKLPKFGDLQKYYKSFYYKSTPETRQELKQYFIDKNNIKENKLSLIGILE